MVCITLKHYLTHFIHSLEACLGFYYWNVTIWAIFGPKYPVLGQFTNFWLLWVIVYSVVLDIIILCIKRYMSTIIHCFIPKIEILPFLTLIGGYPILTLNFKRFWKFLLRVLYQIIIRSGKRKSRSKALFILAVSQKAQVTLIIIFA